LGLNSSYVFPYNYLQGAWWGCLKAVMQWAQETIHGSTGRGVQDAGNAIREEGDFLIIDRAALHRLGLFPEAWPMPLRAVSLCKANAAAASKAGLPKPTLFPSEAEKQQQQKQGPKDRGTSAKEQGDKKAEEPVKEEKKGRAPAPVPHGVRRVQLGCKRCRHGRVGCSDCQKREFNKLVEAGHADLVELLDRKECCKKEFGCRVCWEAVLEYEAKREKEGEAAAPASTGAIVPKIEADVPKEQQPSAVVEPKEEAPKHKPTSPAIPSRPNPKTSLKSRDRASGSGSAAAASAMQTSMPLAPRENAPSLPDQLQISDWGPPTISDPLPPAELPQDAHPWGVQRLLTAMNSILGIACAHPNRWVAPQRLLSLAMGSWKQQKSQDLILARAALGCLRNHSWQGFSMYEAQHPNVSLRVHRLIGLYLCFLVVCPVGAV